MYFTGCQSTIMNFEAGVFVIKGHEVVSSTGAVAAGP